MRQWNFIFLSIVWCILFSQNAAMAENLRIISLAPSTTEVLFALGAGDEIVGVGAFCDYPAGVFQKERVGTFSQPNIEKIISLKPDIIFCTGLEQAPVVTKLKQLGLKVFVSDPSSMQELFSSIIQIGDIVGRSRNALDIVNDIKKGIEELRRAQPDDPQRNRPRVYVEIWHSPLMTAGSGSFLDEMIMLAGGVNMAHDIDKQFVNISSETVIRGDPEVIFLAYMDKAPAVQIVMNRPFWRDVPAVKNLKVYNDIDPNCLLRPGPRLLDGIKKMRERLSI